jgi:hypothetical protein
VLLDAKTLRGLADGTVDHTYRRWAVVRVHVGSAVRTRVGVVEVTSLDRVEPDGISADDATGAGFGSADAARVWIERRGDGDLYRVGLRIAGPDPRVALRDDDDLDADAVTAIAQRLARMDRAADEPWTRRYLELVAAGPPSSRASSPPTSAWSATRSRSASVGSRSSASPRASTSATASPRVVAPISTRRPGIPDVEVCADWRCRALTRAHLR